jgi:hypothetical protein
MMRFSVFCFRFLHLVPKLSLGTHLQAKLSLASIFRSQVQLGNELSNLA